MSSHDDAPLRIAHCIHDLACGDESRINDLKVMVESDDPAYRQIFTECCWLPTEEEKKQSSKAGRKPGDK
jgi:hypothetical protein